MGIGYKLDMKKYKGEHHKLVGKPYEYPDPVVRPHGNDPHTKSMRRNYEKTSGKKLETIHKKSLMAGKMKAEKDYHRNRK